MVGTMTIPKSSNWSWSPTNAYGWWYAGSMTKGNGVVITNWPDSASTHNLQVWDASTTHGPYFTNSSISGQPGLYWVRTAHQGLTNNFGTTLAQPIVVMAVALVGYITSGYTPIMFDGTSSGTRESAIFQPYGTFTTNGLYAGTGFWYGSAAILTNTWYLFTYCFNGSSSFIRTNAVLYKLLSSTPGTLGNAGLDVGDRYDNATGADPFGGQIAELVLYNGLPATNDMIWAETNLCHKYSIGGY